MNYAYELIKILKKKWRRSFYVYLGISLTLFFLTAFLAIFNLYAIRFNPGKEDNRLMNERWIFLAITIISAITTMITSISTFFAFKKKTKIYAKQKRRIKNELEKFKNGEEEYGQKGSDKLFVEKITRLSLE